MALITAESWQSLTSQTVTGTDLTAVRGWCAAVSSALVQILKPFHPEPITISNAVLDAPLGRELILPVRPVRSITSIYHRSDAYGVVANFTSDYLIDNSNGDEYQLVVDDAITGWARGGIVRRIGTIWGYETTTYPERLGATLSYERGSLLVNYTAGPTVTPPEIEAAAVLAVSLLFARKKTGMPVVSESWNGYSASYAGPLAAMAAIHSPDVLGLLSPYMPTLRFA